MKTNLTISAIQTMLQSSNTAGWKWQRVVETVDARWSLVQSDTCKPLNVFADENVLNHEARSIAQLYPTLLQKLANHENAQNEVLERLVYIHMALCLLAEQTPEQHAQDERNYFEILSKMLQAAMTVLQSSGVDEKNT